MDQLTEILIAVVCSAVASSGLWAFVIKKIDKKDVTREMLVGLAHDRITYLGLCYIEQGWITQDEYENLNDYLYKPYVKMDGNGSARRIMAEVDKLPICKSKYYRNQTQKGDVNHVTE